MHHLDVRVQRRPSVQTRLRPRRRAYARAPRLIGCPDFHLSFHSRQEATSIRQHTPVPATHTTHMHALCALRAHISQTPGGGDGGGGRSSSSGAQPAVHAPAPAALAATFARCGVPWSLRCRRRPRSTEAAQAREGLERRLAQPRLDRRSAPVARAASALAVRASAAIASAAAAERGDEEGEAILRAVVGRGGATREGPHTTVPSAATTARVRWVPPTSRQRVRASLTCTSQGRCRRAHGSVDYARALRSPRGRVRPAVPGAGLERGRPARDKAGARPDVQRLLARLLLESRAPSSSARRLVRISPRSFST